MADKRIYELEQVTDINAISLTNSVVPVDTVSSSGDENEAPETKSISINNFIQEIPEIPTVPQIYGAKAESNGDVTTMFGDATFTVVHSPTETGFYSITLRIDGGNDLDLSNSIYTIMPIAGVIVEASINLQKLEFTIVDIDGQLLDAEFTIIVYYQAP